MNRRRFFSFLGASAAALATVPLIGRLVAKSAAAGISLPPAGRMMPFRIRNDGAASITVFQNGIVPIDIEAGECILFTWDGEAAKWERIKVNEFGQGHNATPTYREAQHQKNLMFKGLMDQS